MEARVLRIRGLNQIGLQDIKTKGCVKHDQTRLEKENKIQC